MRLMSPRGARGLGGPGRAGAATGSPIPVRSGDFAAPEETELAMAAPGRLARRGHSWQGGTMQVEDPSLPGVLILTPRRFGDARGFFAETWNRKRFKEAGIGADFVQDNHSLSERAGTIRGLHFQAPPHAQGKLVRCGRGCLLDVAVDIRRGSPTWGDWITVELSAKNGRQLWIPEGFAHGFLTLEDATEIVYKCTDYYAPAAERAVRWDSCGINWDWPGEMVLSEKDAAAPPLSEVESPFVWT